MEIPLPSPDDPNYIQDFCKTLSNKFTEIVKSGNENSGNDSNFMFKLYNFASTAHRPEFISESDWNYLRTNIYLFLSTLDPKEDQIPGISLKTDDGILFSSIIIQYCLRKNNKIFADDLVQAYDFIIDTIINREGPVSIYSYSPSFYARNLPKLLCNALSEESSRFKFVESLQKFITKKNVYLTDSDLSFYSEIVRMLNEKEYCPPELFSFFNHVFQHYQHIPIQIVNHFLNAWRMALSVNKTTPPNEIEKTEIPSDILLHIAKMKAHDLPRSFPWHICFQYYESLLSSPKNQFKVFITINNIIRNIKRIDITNRIDSLAQLFFRVMKTQFKKGGEKEGYHLLYYFLTNVISTISSATARLKVLKGIQMKHSGSPVVSFAKQPQDGEFVIDIDHELFTRFDVKECETPEEEIHQFDHLKRSIDSISKQLQFSIKFNIIEPFRINDLMEFPNSPDKRLTEPTISLLYYFKLVLRSWLNFLLSFSYRVTMMNYYLFHGDGLLKFSGPGPTIRRQLDYTILHREIIDSIVSLPKEMTDLIVKEFFKVIIMSLKNETLTHHFIIFFIISICQKKPIFKKELLLRMVQYCLKNLDFLCMESNKQSHFLNQWILVLFRIGFKPNKPDLAFFNLLQSSQKFVVSGLMNFVRQITNPTETLKSFDWFRRMLYESSGSKFPVIPDQDMLKIRRHLLDELPISTHKCLLRIIFDPIMLTPKQTLTISLIASLLTEAFNSEDQSVISMALKIFIPLLKKETIQKFCDFDFDKYQTIFTSLFNSTKYATEADANTIFHIIPSLSPFFIKKPIELARDPFTVIFDPYGITVKELLLSINRYINDNISESIHLFTIYVHLFNKTKECFFENYFQASDTLTLVLSNLIGLYKYEEIRSQVFDFLISQNDDFALHMIQTRNNMYFLILFSVIGFSRSHMARYTIDIIHNFLNKLEELNVDDQAISDTMNDILSSSNITISHFNIFIGIGIIYKHFPNVLTISHIFRLFSTTSENIQHDMKNLPLLNKFLKLFFAKVTDDIKKQFVEYIFQRIHMIWYGYRFMLTARLAKLGIPITFDSYNDLNNIENNSLFILKTSVAFACGITGNDSQFLSDDMKMRIMKIIQGLDVTPTQHGFESKVIILMIYLSIVSNDVIRLEFFNYADFIQMMFLFLKKMIYRKYPILFKAAKKLFKIIFRTSLELPAISNIVDKFYKSDSVSFLGSNILASFVLHMTRLIPHKCPTIYAKIIIEAIFTFGKKSHEDQMNFLPAIISLVKVLLVEPYRSRKEVLDIFSLPKSHFTYLYFLIDALVRFCQDKEIPYHSLLIKQIKKLFLDFPDESMHIIIFQFSEVQAEALALLEEIIIPDPMSPLLTAFFEALKNNFDKISIIHPCVYETLFRFIKQDRIMANLSFQEYGTKLFKEFSTQYNNNLTFGLNGFLSLMLISKIYLKIVAQDLTYENIFSFSDLFLHPSFRSSNIYKKFVMTVFGTKSSFFYKGLLEYALELLYINNQEDTFFFEVIINHSIKNISPGSEEFQEFLWAQIEKMKMDSRLNTIRLIIVLRITEMKTIYNLNKLDQIIKSLPLIYTESDPHHIFIGYKITQSLQKHDLLPDKVFLNLISMFIRYGKYLDTPYAYCTMQLMKSRPDLLAKLDKELIKSFLFFTLEKLPFLKDLQKIVFAVQAGPKFLDFLPFPVVSVITSSVEKKLEKFIPSTKMNSSIENYLTCAIKICIYSQPPASELANLYAVCFKYMKIVVSEKLRVKDFPDILCSIMLKYGCDNFDIDFLNLVTISSPKEKYYFYFLSVASKLLTNKQITAFHDAYTDAIKSISHEYYKTNYVSTMFQGLAKDEELWSLFSHTIEELITDIHANINENNNEVLVIIIQVIFKSNLKIDKMKYIESLWGFIDNMTEMPHLKQMYKFIMMFADEIPLQMQEYYYDMIKVHSSKSRLHNEVLVLSSHILMKCQYLQNSIKLDFAKHMSQFLSDYSVETLERLLETYDEYSESMNIDMFKYKLPIYFHLMLYSTHNKSVIFAEKLILALGSTIPERFQNAYNLFPLTVWNNDQIAATSILIFGKVNGWQPMAVFAKSFKEIGSKIFFSLLEILENSKESLIVMKSLCIALSDLPNYGSAVEALIKILIKHEINLALIVPGALKYNQTLFMNVDIDFNLVPDILVLPHPMNDILFSRFKSSNPYMKAAEAQFFIGNYEEAMKIFGSNENLIETPFDSRIYKLTQSLALNGEYEYFSRFLVTREESKSIVTKLYEVFIDLKKNEIEAAQIKLKEALHIYYLLSKDKQEETFYEHDFSDAMQFLLCTFEHAVGDTSYKDVELVQFPIYYSNMAFSSHYQSLFREINRDLKYKLDPNDTIPQIMINDDPNKQDNRFLVLSPGLEKMFRFVNGYDSHGFSSVNIKTILEYSKEYIKTMTNSEPNIDNSINYVNVHRWSNLCFTLFLMIKTPTLLSSAFNAYSKLLSVSEFVPYFIKFEASARIITLLRLGLSEAKNEEYKKACEKISIKLASPELESKREFLHFWIRQVVELQSFPPFAEILVNKMQEYIGLSTVYSMGKVPYDEIIKRPVRDESVRSQLKTLRMFEEVIDYVFSMNFEEFQTQINLEKLFYEMKNNKRNFENVNLLELKQNPARTSFEEYLYSLPLSLVESLSNDPNLVAKVNHSSPSEINELIEFFVPSTSDSFESNKKELYRRIDELNNNMPLPFPTRISTSVTPYLIFLQYNIKKINDSLFVFTFKTSVMKNHTFIVQKNEDYNEQQKCTTFSSFLLLLKQINRYNYSNRIRSLRYSTYLGSDVGQQYSMYALATMPQTLEELFEIWCGEKSSKWRGNKNEIRDDILLNHLSFCCTKEQFLKNQELLIRSASATFFIDHLFLSNYPSMETSMICPQLCEIPILFHEITADFQEKSFSTFRLSPNIKRSLGFSFKEKMILSMASSAQSIVNFSESVNSFMELLICEELKDRMNADSLLEMRNKLNHEILKFSPPASSSSTPRDSVEWIGYIESVIEKAGNVSIQPAERFPWF